MREKRENEISENIKYPQIPNQKISTCELQVYRLNGTLKLASLETHNRGNVTSIKASGCERKKKEISD